MLHIGSRIALLSASNWLLRARLTPTQVRAVIGYSRSWDSVLEQWDKDELETLAPPFHLNPYGGVKAIVNWSLKAGGARSCIIFRYMHLDHFDSECGVCRGEAAGADRDEFRERTSH